MHLRLILCTLAGLACIPAVFPIYCNGPECSDCRTRTVSYSCIDKTVAVSVNKVVCLRYKLVCYYYYGYTGLCGYFYSNYYYYYGPYLGLCHYCRTICEETGLRTVYEQRTLYKTCHRQELYCHSGDGECGCVDRPDIPI
ncbi:uncharacterized protein LOC106176462 [Lingula anatina]|uniref:Uncharacterized protein LOC106176462 n=1 Tax=Lingula anatina TaxID=7574 RepID=A0A1S3JPM3_LINAN|nr:uncharacterized protein LOC106176462 [Lingula anatina]|eukprot:XP_013412313.1 uncharacterized protein LOC106176462 [Lingula anatina]